MKKRLIYLGIIPGLIVMLTIAVLVVISTSATAGIGPAGFAYYARQGILHGISLAYDPGHNPYTVKCQDHPNYQTLNDNVTCQIRLKP